MENEATVKIELEGKDESFEEDIAKRAQKVIFYEDDRLRHFNGDTYNQIISRIIKEFAKDMGGTLFCSRPIVDMNWLPKHHQVGTSGKSVKPKVYLVLGISGAFQHVAGISGAGTVIAINKDKKAPIFRVADYGVVGDLFTVEEALKAKMKS